MQDRRARAEHHAADLRKRQHFAGRIPDHPRPDEDAQPRARRFGQQHAPGGPEEHEQSQRVQAKDREPAPSDRRPPRANTAPKPTYMTQVQGEGEPQSGDDCDADFTTMPTRLGGGLPGGRLFGSHETARQSRQRGHCEGPQQTAGRKGSCAASFSARQMSISSATSMSSPSDFAPVTVKLLSCTPLPTSRAMPMRSQMRNSQTASTFSSK